MQNSSLRELYSSSTANIVDCCCHEEAGSISEPEITETHSIVLIQKGHFEYNVMNQTLGIYSGNVMHFDPGIVYVASHPVRGKDECTIIKVSTSILSEMRSNYWKKTSIWSHDYSDFSEVKEEKFFPFLLTPSNPKIEFLHAQLLQLLKFNQYNISSRLIIDTLVINLCAEVFRNIYTGKQESARQLTLKDVRLYTEALERAREFIYSHFNEDIDLHSIASAAYMSEYHFLRIFKRLTGFTPYQYLLEVRLQHSLQLLRYTKEPVAQICFESGFQSLPNFISTFHKRFGITPSKAR